MGAAYIEDFKGRVTEDERLRIHLKHNHFPPVPDDFMAPAAEALALVIEQKGQQPITLPNGITKTAWEIVDGLNMHDFLPVEL